MDYGEAGPSVAVYGQDEPHSDAEEPIDQTDDSAGIKHDSLSSTRQLYVCNIARKTSKDLFDMYFSKYGEITYSFIPLDKISGRSRGFGFVTFASAEVADKVLQEEHVIDGRAVHVKRLAPRWQGRGGVSRRIFVGGLPSSINEDDLRDYFSSYGNIVEHKIIFDNITKESMGYGFVTFENEDAVEKILSDDRMHELGGNQVDIRKAEPRKRFHHGRSSRRSSGNFAGGSDGFGGGYGGQMGRGGYGSYGSYGGYSGYGNFPGYYHAGYGYGYGYGFGVTMYGGGFYGGPTGYGQGYSVYDAGAISYGPYYGEQGGRHNAGATSYGQDDGRQGGGYDTGATAYGQDEGG